MLVLAFILLGAAGLLGMILVAAHAKRRPPAWVGALHGALGVAGLLLLIVALSTAATRPSVFGIDAAALIGGASLTAIAPIASRVRRRPISGLWLGLHATLAIMGLVILTAVL